MIRTGLALTLLLVVGADTGAQTPREKKVREDKAKVEADGFWIYNDLSRAFQQAKTEKKPLVVVLRCIPCEECVKLDDHLVDTDPVLRPLLEKFVRVRVVSTNNLDLSLFQFDYDQSFAVFFLNADGTIYGRFGTRSHRTNWLSDVSVEGLAQALAGALELHAEYPKNKESLAGKRGADPLYPVPQQFPSLRKYGAKLDYTGNVVQSCIHCHQIGDAIKDHHRKTGQAMPDEVLFPYPHPKTIGLILDPKKRASVLKVEPGSPAEKSGVKAGDTIVNMDGQPPLSIADIQWVLHRTRPEGAELKLTVLRATKSIDLTLHLPRGWRDRDDIAWRSSSWGLRRMATGGLLLEPIDGQRPAGVPRDGMALRVKHVGQYGPHAAAHNAGFKVGDVLVAFDGKSDLLRETDVLAYAVRTRKPGDRVPVVVIRAGQRLELTLPMQD
jgi:hypothetical protein